MIKTKIILTNDFHNTSCQLRVELFSHYDSESTAYITACQAKKAKAILCGSNNCNCSGKVGTRGKQEHDGKQLKIMLSTIRVGSSSSAVNHKR